MALRVCLIVLFAFGSAAAQVPQVNVKLVTDEAEAVLSALAKRKANQSEVDRIFLRSTKAPRDVQRGRCEIQPQPCKATAAVVQVYCRRVTRMRISRRPNMRASIENAPGPSNAITVASTTTSSS